MTNNHSSNRIPGTTGSCYRRKQTTNSQIAFPNGSVDVPVLSLGTPGTYSRTRTYDVVVERRYFRVSVRRTSNQEIQWYRLLVLEYGVHTTDEKDMTSIHSNVAYRRNAPCDDSKDVV